MSSQALSSPKDWQNRKIWLPSEQTFSGNTAASLELLGLKTVPALAKDVKKSLRSGIIDTFIAPSSVALMKRWHTAIENVYIVPFSYNYGLWVVRDEALEKFSFED